LITEIVGRQIMEENSIPEGIDSIKDLWNKLPTIMKILVVIGDLAGLGFLIYYFAF